MKAPFPGGFRHPSWLLTALAVASLASVGGGAPAQDVAEVFIVELEEPPLARYVGGVQDLQATSPAATGARKLDARHPASVSYLHHLRQIQELRLEEISGLLGRESEVQYRYVAVANGFSLRLRPDEISAVAGMRGVTRVQRDRLLRLATDAGPRFIGAPGLWDGSATPGLPGTMGEGVLIGVIDTGINMDHPSFSDAPPDGHSYVNPFGQGIFVGWCDPDHPNHDPAWVCNDKLVGAWDFADAMGYENDGPEDGHFHGSHTASTAAGNVLVVPPISGVAPHANLIAYDACYNLPPHGEVCPLSTTVAAIDQAVLDGVEVINFSIEGGASPWDDVDSFLLNAVAAGVFVAASADNTGPDPGTVLHLGPWVASVGASTHDRVANESQLVEMTGGVSPPADMTGSSLTQGLGPATIVWAGDFANGTPSPELCLEPFPQGTWSGSEIVVCDWAADWWAVGVCQNVAVAGAGGCVLANLPGTTYVEASAHVVPGIHLDAAAGEILRSWVAGCANCTARLTQSVVVLDPAAGDLMASFSSRGPAPDLDLLKPDLTAPGVRILAAMRTGLIPGFEGDEFARVSGTSMAAPHVAGAAALLVALRPELSPPELLSALAMTAYTTLLDGDDDADPFDRGCGRVDLREAGRVALVLDETVTNFAAADPAQGGDPRTLNLPGLVDDDCFRACQWLRAVTSVRAEPTTWTVTASASPGLELTVSPPSFTIGGVGSSQDLAVTSTVADTLPLGAWAFAEVVLSSDHFLVATHRFTVAVLPTAPASLIFADGFESADTSAWSATVP